MNAAATTTWTSRREMVAVITKPHHAKKTLTIALVVGTVFFAMNQLSIVVAGRATPMIWFKIALTYLTPLAVSNFGVLSATHRRNEVH